MNLIVPFGAMLGGFGLVLGSFFNVVIWRVPRRMSVVRPRSGCPDCGTRIRGRDNVPVLSWLLLRGRCRDCGHRISAQYPAIELLTGVAFVGVAIAFGGALVDRAWGPASAASALEVAAFLLFASVSIILSVIDIQLMTIPDRILGPSIVAAIVLLGAAGAVQQDAGALVRAAIGAAGLFLFYFVVWFIRPDAMGLGDVKLAAIIGVYLGYLGWEQLAVGAFAAFALGAVVGVALMLARRAGRKSRMPFGPWMFAGAWIGIVAGVPISAAYLTLVGIT